MIRSWICTQKLHKTTDLIIEHENRGVKVQESTIWTLAMPSLIPSPPAPDPLGMKILPLCSIGHCPLGFAVLLKIKYSRPSAGREGILILVPT